MENDPELSRLSLWLAQCYKVTPLTVQLHKEMRYVTLPNGEKAEFHARLVSRQKMVGVPRAREFIAEIYDYDKRELGTVS